MAAEQLTDKENQFKKRARRRLVGAVALVLLMVTVLPMVLDDRNGQKTPQPEIAINIPSQDGAGFSSKIIPVTSEPPPSVKPAVPMAAPLEKPAEGQTPAASAAEPKSPVAVPEQAKPAALPVEQAPRADQPAPMQPKGLPEAVSKAEAPKPAPAEGGDSKKGTVSVQVGVFSDAAKVKQMRTKIAESGVQCYTENLKTPKGAKVRLRCGPFPARTEAQQALERIKAAGFGGILVTNQ